MPDIQQYTANEGNHLGLPVLSMDDITVVTDPNEEPPVGMSRDSWKPAKSFNHMKHYDFADGDYYCTDGDRHFRVAIQDSGIKRIECYGSGALPYIVWHYERDPWRIYREWPQQGIPREQQPFDIRRARERCGIQ
jgi:hypothetical protein